MLECINVKRVKIAYAIVLICLYIISFILVNIGFYVPEWYSYYEQWFDYYWYGRERICNEVGLVSGDCRYPYTGIDKGQSDTKGFAIRCTFYMMTTAICLLYMSLVFLVTGVVFNCIENPIFLSFGSIIAGVLYPSAALLTTVSTIYVMFSNHKHIGYASIITNVGGGLMLICYVLLRLYKEVISTVKKCLETRQSI